MTEDLQLQPIDSSAHDVPPAFAIRMRGFVNIRSAADYQKWMADQQKELQPAAATPSATPPAR